MPMDTLLALFVKIILMVALGFILKKTHVIDARIQKGLSDLLLLAVLPFSVLASANSPFSAEISAKLGLSAVISAVYYVLSLLLSLWIFRRAMRTDDAVAGRKLRGVLVTMSVFANTGFIGLPLVKALYGAEGMLYGVIYNLAYQLFLFTVGIMLLSGERRMKWRDILGDPATLASIAAVFIYLSPFRFPTIINEAFEAIGDMSVPLSMIVIGSCIGDLKPVEMIGEKRGLLVCALRLILFPLGMAGLLILTGIDGVLACSCIILTALPVGSLNVILAERYQTDVKLATCSVMQSMVLFALTLPVILVVINSFFTL